MSENTFNDFNLMIDFRSEFYSYRGYYCYDIDYWRNKLDLNEYYTV